MSTAPNEKERDAARTPLVSIGLPVFNGERYVAQAIDSILGQTYTDFELIISDNASTDRTAEICQAHAARDPRVRYFRNERNLGAGPNYDLCFVRARGKYFKWTAHDDVIAPTFLEKTVALMEQNPDAVLCCVHVTEIGPDGELVRVYSNAQPGLDSRRPSDRLAGMILAYHNCEDFFGLFRREAMIGSQLHGTYTLSDRVYLAEMALRGRIVTVPEPLFLHREHAERFTRAVLSKRETATSWQDATKRPRRRLYIWSLYWHYWQIVIKTVHDRRDRWACYRQLLIWWFVNYNARDIVKDLLWMINPSLLLAARKIKRALFGVSKPLAPGNLTRVP
jgi:glycosyltransferase involved in cell wall biosynthesis